MACAYCVHSELISDLRQLRVGDHIEFGRINVIKTFLRKLNLCPSITKHLRFGYMYFHHAIVTEINQDERWIKFVEFSSGETSFASYIESLRKAIIQEGIMNFEDNKRDLSRVIHKNIGPDPPNPHDIVKNAKRLLQEAESNHYNLLTYNCEHLANLCVTQHSVSLQMLQVKDNTEILLQHFLTKRPLWFKQLVKTLSRRLISLMEKLEKQLKFLKIKRLFAVYANMKRFIGKWSACALMISVTFLALDLYHFYSASKGKGICNDCLCKWLFKILWRLLSMLVSTNVVFLLAAACCCPALLVYDYLSSNHSITYARLDSLDKVEPGDVITFNLHMPFSYHDAIVVSHARQFTAGHMKPLTKAFSSMEKQEVRGLYELLLDEFFRNEGHPSIEEFDVSVQDNSKETATNGGSDLYEKMNNFLNTPSKLKVKRNILSSTLSINFGMIVTDSEQNILQNNKGQQCKASSKHAEDGEDSTVRALVASGQFCLEEAEDENKNRPRIHFLVANGHIKLYHNFNKLYQVELIHYELDGGLKFPDFFFAFKRVVKSEVKTLDLENKHTVYKKTFEQKSKAYKNPPEVIVRKAVEKIGERRWNFFGRRSSDFVNECVLIDREEYYTRGERFARLFHSIFYNLLYWDRMAVNTCSTAYFICDALKQIEDIKKNHLAVCVSK